MDWIEKYVEVTDGLASPEIFRLWAAIGAVAGAMERRLYVETSLGRLYCNLYIMLVAPPGIGKTEAMKPIEEILKMQKSLNIAPKSMTKAAVIDTLRDARRMIILPNNAEVLEYHSLQIIVSELGVLVNSHDLEFLTVMNEIFDNGAMFRERRRHVNGGKEIQITNPQFNIITGAQPALLTSILPEEAWGLGTTSRFIMVFAGSGHKPDIFGKFVDRNKAYRELADIMSPWVDKMGKFSWDEGAVKTLRILYADDLKPIPESPKLLPYNTRRIQYLIKLSAISALSRTGELTIEEYDVERARHWLLSAETTMPQIFTAMSFKTDMQLIEEMHIFAWREYRKASNAPMSMAMLNSFLLNRVYAERVPKIIELATKSHLIDDLGGGMFRPLPRLDMGQKII